MQGSGKVTAVEVQRLLGQAQQQIAQQQQQQSTQPQAWGSDGAAEDSEAARDGDPPGESLDERLKRRCVPPALTFGYRTLANCAH